MITVHSLAYSRASRIVWLLEDLRLPHEVVRYERTEAWRAPETLARVHPLGKSPVLVDGDLTLVESSAILRYLHSRHGQGTHAPAPGTVAAARHDEWLDYAEGTFARAVVPAFWSRKVGAAFDDAARALLDRHLDFVASGLEGRDFLTGDAVSLADIQMSYLIAMTGYGRGLDDRPELSAYLDRLMAQPGMVRAIETTGPVMPAA